MIAQPDDTSPAQTLARLEKKQHDDHNYKMAQLLIQEGHEPRFSDPTEIITELHKVATDMVEMMGGVLVANDAIDRLRHVVAVWRDKPTDQMIINESTWIVQQTQKHQAEVLGGAKPVIECGSTTKLTNEQLHPTPLIGTWVDWILAGAHRPQPELSLMSVVSACSAIIGRSFTHRGMYANQYMFALAPTGSGKERVRMGSEKVIKAVGASEILGGSDIVSDAGIIGELTTYPQRIWISDEVHRILARVAKPNAESYHLGVVAMLLQGYLNNEIRGRGLKDGAAPTISMPYMNILGLSQPRSLWPVASAALAGNGFLGRFLVFSGHRSVEFNDTADTAPELPDQDTVLGPIVSYVQRMKNQSRVSMTAIGAGPRTTEIDMGPGVQERERQIISEIDAEIAQRQGDELFNDVTVRMFEHLRKLVLVHAWSQNPMCPVASVAGVEWAYALVKASRNTLMSGASGGQMATPNSIPIDMMEQFIKDNSPINMNKIYKRFRGVLNYEKIIESMTKNGVIKLEVTRIPGKPGKPPTIVTYMKDSDV